MVKKVVIGIAWFLIPITKAMNQQSQPTQYRYQTISEEYQKYQASTPAPPDNTKDQPVQTSGSPSIIYLTNKRSFILLGIKCKKIPDPATFQKREVKKEEERKDN